MQEPSKFCSACGAQSNLGAQFCRMCGARYSGAPPLPGTPARPKQKLPTGLLLLCVLVIIAFGGILELRPKTRPDDTAPIESPMMTNSPMPTPTPDAPKEASDYEKVVYNDLGRMTIKGKGGELTSIKLDAISQAQKEKLQAMLLYLEVSNLTAQRACSLTLAFGGWRDRGAIHNCSGDRIGTLNDEAVRYMRDRVNAALQGKSK